MKIKIIALMAAGLLTMSLVAPAFAGSTKVLVCHLDGDDRGRVIDITMTAYENNHWAHGDTLDFVMVDGYCVEAEA